jgi:molybdate transport system permease protein
MGKSRIGNQCFRAIILVFIFMALCLVVAAIGNILWSGTIDLVKCLQSAEIQFSIRLSFLTAFASTLLCMVIAIPIAYGLERMRLRGRQLIGIIFDVPMALPPLVSGLALLLLFATTGLGQALARYGINFIFTVQGIVLAQFFVNLPYLIRFLRSTIADVDPRLEFVARTLGCTQWQAFYKVILPLIRNGLLAGLVTTWSRALGEFGAVLMLAGATRMKTEILPTSLYLNLATGDLDLAMAAAVVLILVSLLSLLVFELLGRSSVTLSR